MVVCPKCKKERDEDEMMETDDGNKVCDRCAVKYYAQCDGCGIIVTKKVKEKDGYELCEECYENWEDEEEDEDEEEWDDDEDDDYDEDEDEEWDDDEEEDE